MQSDRRIDTYIEKSAPFAHPILEHLRDLIHRAIPEVEETIKWRMPFFTLNGVILAHVAAFKAHCALGLWGTEITARLKADKITPAGGGGGSMGSFGRITSLADLPKTPALLSYLRAAAAEVSSGRRTVSFQRPAAAKPTPTPKVPAELAAALKKSPKASAAFRRFSPACRREHIQWIAEAKRPETRTKRVAQAIGWISQGKSRNWKYQ